MAILKNCCRLFDSYGYRQIACLLLNSLNYLSVPLVSADIVEEMYPADRNGDYSRPEGTASCVRAVLEHSLAGGGQAKALVSGPMFRHERPQKDVIDSFIKLR